MSTNGHTDTLRNITANDFILGPAPQAQEFWLTAFNAYQHITSDYTRSKLTQYALSNQHPSHGSAGHLGIAVTNSTVTDAIKQFLPLEYKDASHTWICGQFQTSIARTFLARLSDVARDSFCRDIPLDRPVVAAGNLFTVAAFLLVFIVCTTAVILYLIHAATNGPRRTCPESFKDHNDSKRKKLETLLTSQALSSPPLRYPSRFFSLLYPWMTTITLLPACTFVWTAYGNPDTRLAYNEALTILTLRLSTATAGCLVPLPCKFFELPSFTASNVSAFFIFFSSMSTFIVDIIVLGVPQDFDSPNLYFRDTLCSADFFLDSLKWARLLVALKYAVLVGMWILHSIVYYALYLLFSLMNRTGPQKLQQRSWPAQLEQGWSLVHQFKIWVVLEWVSLVQAAYSIWWMRRRVIDEELYADFHSAVFDGSSFVACLMFFMAAGFITIVSMDWRVRWNRMALWSKSDETVDGSDDMEDTELEILAAKTSSNWADIFVTR